MHSLKALLAVGVAVAASQLGGCSTPPMSESRAPVAAPARAVEQAATEAATEKERPRSPRPERPTARAQTQAADAQTGERPARRHRAPGQTAGQTADAAVAEQFASLALDDGALGEVRGGIEIGGLTLSFAFQQSTFINHDLAQNIVVPTITISAGSAAAAASRGSSPTVGIPSLAGFGMTAPVGNTGGANLGATTIVSNGVIQTQLSASNATIQSLVNSGIASVVSGLGNSGLTTVISNTLNNQLVQQVVKVDIGVTGLSQLLRPSLPTAVSNALSRARAFR